MKGCSGTARGMIGMMMRTGRILVSLLLLFLSLVARVLILLLIIRVRWREWRAAVKPRAHQAIYDTCGRPYVCREGIATSVITGAYEHFGRHPVRRAHKRFGDGLGAVGFTTVQIGRRAIRPPAVGSSVVGAIRAGATRRRVVRARASTRRRATRSAAAISPRRPCAALRGGGRGLDPAAKTKVRDA